MVPGVTHPSFRKICGLPKEVTHGGIDGEMARRLVQTEEMLPLLKRHGSRYCTRGPLRRRTCRLAPGSRRTGSAGEAQTESRAPTTPPRDRRGRSGGPRRQRRTPQKVSAWLSEEPELPTQGVLVARPRRATPVTRRRSTHSSRAFVPPRATPVVRFEGLPGEFLATHDFGHVDVRFVDGRKQHPLLRLTTEVLPLRRCHARRQRAH